MDRTQEEPRVVHVPEAGRYEAHLGGHVAITAYEPAGDAAIRFTHTEVPEALEGRGVGSRLVRGALDDARRRGLRVIPECSFVAAWVRRHEAYHDLIGGEDREASGSG